MNRWTGTGHLTKDPKFLETESGTAICTLRLAVKRAGKQGQDGYFDVKCFDGQASACAQYLKAGREVFAAGMSGAGWPIGTARSTPTGQLLARLKLEVARYRHIPVHVLVGGGDAMKYGSKAVHQEILAQGGKSTYVEFPGTKHVESSAKAWGNPKHIEWLFAQSRKNNPAPGKDPYPGGVYPK